LKGNVSEILDLKGIVSEILDLKGIVSEILTFMGRWQCSIHDGSLKSFAFVPMKYKSMLMSVHKKCQPNRSDRLAGNTQHVYIRMACFII